jgi:hypothetical protein
MIHAMWRLLAVLAVVAVVWKLIETLALVAVVVGSLYVVGNVVLRVSERRPILAGGPDVEMVPCCDYRHHEGEAAVCGCVNHPRSHIHPFGENPWPL